MIRSGNPTLTAKTFTLQERVSSTAQMTIQGTVNKTGFLLFLVLIPAIWTWDRFISTGDQASIVPFIIGGAIGGIVIALITVFNKTWAPFTAPLYALAEGFVLGGISAIFESIYPDIVFQAVGLTMGVLFSLLMAYKSGLIKVTENFNLGIVAATGGIMMVYLASMVLGFFGMGVPFIHENGLMGIGFSAFVVVIAALNLVLDFDFIEAGAKNGAPKYMEWYGAFGLLVTLIWLYIEILHLLAKLRSR